MPSSTGSTFRRILPLAAFNQLDELLRQMGQEQSAVILTEFHLGSSGANVPGDWTRFTLTAATAFSALLLGKATSEQVQTYQMDLTFEPEVIETFLTKLDMPSPTLEKIRQALQPNDARLQSEFTLRLLELLIPKPGVNVASTAIPASIPAPQYPDQTLLQPYQLPLEQLTTINAQELHDALLAAQTANKVKSEFLAIMNHELRTPLTCVIGMSATLLRWSVGSLSQRQQEFLKTIHDSGEHLLDLIQNILDISELEASKIILNVSEFSLSGLAHQSLQTFRERAYLSQVELETNLDIAPEQDRFVADPQRVKQILLNLLSNAIKFTPVDGKVTLSVRVERDMAIFEVKDTGIGIPKHQQPLLFQKFQQLDTSYQRQYKGAGLGLALIKQLVELHDGSISVESQIGVGSIFTVEIPNQRLNSEASLESAAGSSASKNLGGRIVLFEDHEESANIICDMLTAAGYQVVWMIEGSTVIEQVELLQPIVVITDTQLTEGNGYEIIRSLRQHPTTQAIKILALTTATTPAGQQPCFDAGANDYLTKPIQPDQLLRKISALTSISIADSENSEEIAKS
ncbi:MAG: response regulator [Cyanothece sp. SIO1E1]|nr:response regulator [Cyanothece sp. SIO1E1]